MSSTVKEKISKWRSDHVSFSNAALFISGLVFSHALVEYAILSVLISFITNSWEDDNLPKAAAIVNIQEGISILIAIVVAYVADDWLGRFNTIFYTMTAFITGLVLLLRFSTSSGGIFYLAVFLLTLGNGGNPTLHAFVKDQFDPEHNAKMAEARNEKMTEVRRQKMTGARSEFWWRTAWFLGATTATVVSSRISMGQLIMTSLIITGVTYLLFLLGIRFYKRNPPTHDITYKMIHWRSLLKLLPLWMTFLIYSLVEAAGSTFFFDQSSRLKDHIGNGFQIPLTFFAVHQSLTKYIISHMADFLISKFWKEESGRRRARTVRIAIGMLFSLLCCLTAREVEFRRLELIKKSSNEDEIKMHILWLTPQFFLLGCTTGLVEEGLEQFFYDHVPESMKQYELPFNQCVLGIGKFLTAMLIAFFCKNWFGKTSDTSHLDRYYLLLVMLSLVAFLFFILAVSLRDWRIATDTDSDPDLENGLTDLHQIGSELPSDSGETIGRPTPNDLLRFPSSLSFNGERSHLSKYKTNGEHPQLIKSYTN